MQRILNANGNHTISSTTSGRRELMPADIVMTGVAENLSPVAQSVSVSWVNLSFLFLAVLGAEFTSRLLTPLLQIDKHS